eukprot:NODE_10056_length_1380_cov_3.315243.p1 GENE.NODE_10056_length_1380_cov_3.315243~~NODE_10056_length_1380_cov_3.315243.p1  ORF type:complete len:207 (+),score=66.93 NODE_10056_length_1380_cov_3.315243:491-1111(+)
MRRLKEENLQTPDPPVVPEGLTLAEIKNLGNEAFKRNELELAVASYTVAIKLCEGCPTPDEAEDPKYISVLYGNRAQCHINLCREAHGEDVVEDTGKETRRYAMLANLDASKAIEYDPTNGKAYYRRGCAVLGMAATQSRAQDAIWFLELALSGRSSGGGQDGIVLPNVIRQEVGNLLDYAKRRLDACTECAVPDIEVCREQCRNQ